MTGTGGQCDRYGERGVSLVAVAALMLVMGMFMAVGARVYGLWEAQNAMASTQAQLAQVQSAMQDYYTRQGRYPCPAPLTAAIDAPGYGREVSSDCGAGAFAGTFRAQGEGGRWVRTGAVPVRDLDLPDSYMTDAYGKRLIYAVTEQYAVQGTPVAGDAGAITILDANGNNATAVAGNVVQIVYSMGIDPNGAYTVNGVNVSACNTAAVSGENCDFDNNATFLNTVSKSQRQDNMFVHSMSYVPHRHVLSCEEVNAGIPRAKHTSFLVDTSGSMAWAGQGSDGFNVQCPHSMPGCSRMDVARWALRRTIPAHIYSNNQQDDPGTTAMTGFVATNTVTAVTNVLNNTNIIFDDPTAAGYVPPEDEDVLDRLEPELQAMCPAGGTPLGIHMMALANQLRTRILADIANGGNPDQFAKIIVFSDGVSNNGMTPAQAAQNIAAMRAQTPPIDIRVDIIDVVGNDASLRSIAEDTGGTYFNTGNPDELLDALYAATGVCASHTPATPVDRPGCGSQGNWWNNTQ